MEWQESGVRARVGLGDVVRAWGFWGVAAIVLLGFLWWGHVSLEGSVKMLYQTVLWGQMFVFALLGLRSPVQAMALERRLGSGVAGRVQLENRAVGAVMQVGEGEIVVFRADGLVGHIPLSKDDPVKVVRPVVNMLGVRFVSSHFQVGEDFEFVAEDRGRAAEEYAGLAGFEYQPTEEATFPKLYRDPRLK